MPADAVTAPRASAWSRPEYEAAYRAVRYALAATLATLMGTAAGFELPFLVPVLILGFFAKPVPRPALRVALSIIAVVAGASAVGLVMARLLLPYPYLFLLVAFLALFRIFYLKAGGGSPLLVVFLLMGVVLIPIIALESLAFSAGIALALVASSVMVTVTAFLVHDLMPDLPTWQSAVRPPAPPAPPPEPAVRFRTAMLSTGVVYPVFAIFFLYGWTGSLLILLFIAILSQVPSFTAGKAAGKALIQGNLLGGLGAIVLYNMLIVVPTFGFFLALTFGAGLVYGRGVYSDRPWAPLFATGFSTVVLLLGMSVSIEGTEAASKFYQRILQVMAAVFYVVAAFGFLEILSRRRGAL
jgi:hypothetical protein